MHVTSPRTLVPVLLARHTRRNLRAHISCLAMYCLWVRLSVQTQESRAQDKPQAASGGKAPLQGAQHPLQEKRLSRECNTLSRTKMPRETKSKNLVKFPSLVFVPRASFSLSRLMGCLHVKGEPPSIASREPLLLETSRTPRPC